MHFFHLGILAQGIYNAHTMFHQFSDITNGGKSQQPSVLSQLVTSESQHPGLSCPKESQSYLPLKKFI